jgi:hypothetical protein
VKFHNNEDYKLFLLEVEDGESALRVSESTTPSVPSELLELFIKRRKKDVKRVKDLRRSREAKSNWRHNRSKYKKGIKKFHKSTKGKRFHRSLGRFLATRDFKSSMKESLETISVDILMEAAKALSSLKTHLIIETYYYQTLEDQVELELLFEAIVPTMANFDRYILDPSISLEESDLDLLTCLVERNSLTKELILEYGEENSDSIKDQVDSLLIEVHQSPQNFINLESIKLNFNKKS